LPIRIEPVSAFVEDIVKVAAHSSFEHALPHDADTPPQGTKLPCDLLVAFHVTFDLTSPEFTASIRPLEQVAAVLMPKTAVGEQDCTLLRKDQIWSAGHVSPVKTESKTSGVQTPAQHQFGRCVFPTYASHHLATLAT
jgi:hypothetical protein